MVEANSLPSCPDLLRTFAIPEAPISSAYFEFLVFAAGRCAGRDAELAPHVLIISKNGG
jgi:hypothetical protein